MLVEKMQATAERARSESGELAEYPRRDLLPQLVGRINIERERPEAGTSGPQPNLA